MDTVLGFYQTDCDTILSHLNHQNYQIKLKRRWLIGFPLSKSEKKKLLRYKSLPETFLRDDDMFYDIVKKHVEEAFGVNNGRKDDNIIEETKRLFEKSNLKRIILLCLDALTNKGLYRLAMLLTKGSINVEKTRPKMKKLVKESITKVSRVQNLEVQVEIFTQLSQLLGDPQNVRDNFLTHMFPTFHSHYASAVKILNGLEELPTETLLAMWRKLRGDPAHTPCLKKTRHGFSRNELISKVRRSSKKMLSKLIRGDELKAPLAKALAMASLSQKLTPAFSVSLVSDFDQFSPETKTLQNQLAKAICLLEHKSKVRIKELKILQHLLDPDAKVPNACLRTAIKKMLTDYLFECSDLETIPKSLLNALALINRSSRNMPIGCFLKDEIEEEVNCILSLSAQMKQVVWDLLPDHDYDEDFTDVYIEELEESDDDVDDLGMDDPVAFDDVGMQMQARNVKRQRSYSVDLDSLEESCGEYVPLECKPSISSVEGDHGWSPFESKNNAGRNSFDTKEAEQSATVVLGNPSSSSFCSKGEDVTSNGGNSTTTNLYLGIQKACDETSMLAYNLIGYMMEKFAQEEGIDLDESVSTYLRGDDSDQEKPGNVAGSVMLQAVEELVPSLPKSVMEKLKELIGNGFGH